MALFESTHLRWLYLLADGYMPSDTLKACPAGSNRPLSPAERRDEYCERLRDAWQRLVGEYRPRGPPHPTTDLICLETSLRDDRLQLLRVPRDVEAERTNEHYLPVVFIANEEMWSRGELQRETALAKCDYQLKPDGAYVDKPGFASFANRLGRRLAHAYEEPAHAVAQYLRDNGLAQILVSSV